MRSTVILLCLLIFFSTGFGMNLKKEIDLRGEWRFEIGDKDIYASPSYNDSHWEGINVPSTWENEGFPNYDGYAWYRIKFRVKKELEEKKDHLYLKLGRIDDVDMTFFNGHYFAGRGSYPPNYKTAYDEKRVYHIPPDMIKFGKDNYIAIRVYDLTGGGGIYNGEVGIYSRKDFLNLAERLSGSWKFKAGDDSTWSDKSVDDTDWHSIKVPGCWENQGFENIDGYAWYRKYVKIDKKLADNKLILILGKINDMDQVFFNGTQIGMTGDMPYDKSKNTQNYKDIERAYFIPPDLIEKRGYNLIAVRVFDYGKAGGIYEGYIGITTRANYLKYQKGKK